MTRYLIWISVLCFTACYSFKGITIPPEVNTFYVENFQLRTSSAPAAIEIELSEALRRKVREESRLRASETNPDVEFFGNITGYRVEFAGAQQGDQAALNRLLLNVSVTYTDNLDDENSYTKNYSQITTFSANVDLSDVEEGLVTTLIDEITEQIFNDTYTDW